MPTSSTRSREVRAITDDWLATYNTERPHDSLGRVPPLTFLPRPDSARGVHLRSVYLTGKLTSGHTMVTTTAIYAHISTRRHREKLAEYLK